MLHKPVHRLPAMFQKTSVFWVLVSLFFLLFLFFSTDLTFIISLVTLWFWDI